MELTKDIFDYIESHKDEAFELLTTLAQIPAPSNHEEKRVTAIRIFCVKKIKITANSEKLSPIHLFYIPQIMITVKNSINLPSSSMTLTATHK